MAFLISWRVTKCCFAQSQPSSKENLLNIFTLSWKLLFTPSVLLPFNRRQVWMIIDNPRVGRVFRVSECKEVGRLPRAPIFWTGPSSSQSTLTPSVRLYQKSVKGCMQSFRNSLDVQVFGVTQWASIFGKMGMTLLLSSFFLIVIR